MKIDQPRAKRIIERDKVAARGLSLAQAGTDVTAAIGGKLLNRFDIDGCGYKVIAQLARAARLDAEQSRDVRITGPAGGLVPLGAVARIESRTVPRPQTRCRTQPGSARGSRAGLAGSRRAWSRRRR